MAEIPKPQPTSEEAKKFTPTDVPYTPEELLYRGYLAERLMSAVMQRNGDQFEFNDLNYDRWYEGNAKAGHSYNPPKENEEDTRIVTGTTQEKEATLLSATLNYNLEPNIQAFDKQNLKLVELGENMEDMVRKSREIEHYDEKRPLIYKELFDQGTCFVEEVDTQKFETQKKMKNADWSKSGVDPEKISWTTKLKKLYSQCEVNLLPGTGVYLGNIKQFFLDKQPFAFTRDVIPYNEAQSIYADWARFKFVPRKIVQFAVMERETLPYRDWSVQQVEQDMVEVIKYQDPIKNELMILLNGVMMLPIEFPLTEISPSGRFTFAKGDVEPISAWFAYSKSIPAKTKVDQALLDEMLRMFVLKMRKSLMPPMANNTNKNLSRKVLFPGKITRDIDPTKFLPIGGENQGVTISEFNVFNLLKQIIDEKSVSPVFSGDVQKGTTTATEIIEVKKQQMMKLGLAIWGVISLERQLAYLRLHNILAVWTRKIDQQVDQIRKELVDVYRTVSIDTTFEDGRKGTKIIEFNPTLANQVTPEQIQAEEDYLSEPGRPVRKVYLHPEELRNVEATWYITITPTEKETSELQRVLFIQNVKDAAELFGPQSLNIEHLKQRYAIHAKEDPDKFFLKAQPQQPNVAAGVAMPGAGGASPVPQQIAAGAGGGAQPPSLNQLIK